jgi:hypothetical protein
VCCRSCASNRGSLIVATDPVARTRIWGLCVESGMVEGVIAVELQMVDMEEDMSAAMMMKDGLPLGW